MVLALVRDGDGGREAGFGSRRVKDLDTWRGRGRGACVGDEELDMLMICRVVVLLSKTGELWKLTAVVGDGKKLSSSSRGVGTG